MLEIGFVGVGVELLQLVEPLFRGAPRVEFALFLFCAETNLMFDGGIRDDGEVPGLLVGATGRGAGGAQTIFDDGAGDGAVRELAHGASAAHLVVEVPGALGHGVRRVLVEVGQWDESFVPSWFRLLSPQF